MEGERLERAMEVKPHATEVVVVEVSRPSSMETSMSQARFGGALACWSYP